MIKKEGNNDAKGNNVANDCEIVIIKIIKTMMKIAITTMTTTTVVKV